MARWFIDRSPQRGIPSVSLRRLLRNAQFVGCPDWEVSGCTTESSKLEPGELFVAVRTGSEDGHTQVTQAMARGAAGVVVERACPEAGRLQVIVPDALAAHAAICHALAGDPSDHLRVVGVTGTHGKTATGLYVRSIFEAAGVRFGNVGSLGWSDGKTVRPTTLTPPDAESLAGMLGAMVDAGCAGAVIELGPEVLEQRTADGLELDAALVTTLESHASQDPRVIQGLRRSTARMFKRIASGGIAVVNADEPDAELMGAVNISSVRVAYGIERPADISAVIDQMSSDGSKIRLRGFGRELAISLRLTGESAVRHALAAAALAWARGISAEDVKLGLESVTRLSGRLESVVAGQNFDVRVDSARTPAAISQALATLRALNVAKIHCVFGAEGLGDPASRRALAAAVEAGADYLILTTDNPRSEDPNQIFDDLLSGLRRPGRARVEPDRRLAIETTLANAEPGDVVLIAGKGRRTVQIYADRVTTFDDAAIATDWLQSQPVRMLVSA